MKSRNKNAPYFKASSKFNGKGIRLKGQGKRDTEKSKN
jgi:hypothetical protein